LNLFHLSSQLSDGNHQLRSSSHNVGTTDLLEPRSVDAGFALPRQFCVTSALGDEGRFNRLLRLPCSGLRLASSVTCSCHWAIGAALVLLGSLLCIHSLTWAPCYQLQPKGSLHQHA